MWEFNEYQTQLTDKVLASLSDEELAELEDVLTNVEFVKRLVSKDRKRARDLDRDQSGRIIVDLSNPHILEDMDYFREAAIHFQKYGCYTKLMPNPNPQSEYGQWLKREVRRIWQGMVRPSDGEWIPGDMYFYLNYFPIVQTKIKKGTKIGERVTDLPEVWEGVYWRFHYMHQARFGGLYDDFKGAHHGCEIARRGASKSYSLGAVLTKTFLLGENELSRAKVKSLALAYQKEYLIKDGLINKFVDGLTHCAKYTQFPSNRIKSSWTDMHWVLGFKNDDDDDDGLLNEMIGVAIKDNSDKARGKRSSKVFYEEFGMFPGFLDLWQTSLPNVQEGEIVFGQAYSIGTGGTENSDFSGALEMINYPSGYNVYSLPNFYDRGADGSKRTIFFFPGYVNSKGYYNKDGVSDVVGALISEIKFRVVLKYNSSDPMQLTRRKAETAFTLQDAIMRSSGTAYPADMLNDRINELNLDPKYPDSMWIGRLSMNNEGNVEYKVTPELKYITEFPHKDNKKRAAICIKEQPKKDSAGKIPWGRYIAGADVYDDDGSNTLSLFSLFILDTFTDELVFEYTGRNDFADDDYEIARLACLYYNAELNYENNKKGLFKHFSKHGCLYLLSDTLEYLKDKDVVKGNLYGNKSKGTGNYGKVGYYARRAIREWLLHEQELITVKEENGVPYEDRRNVTMINKLWSKALCQELAMWNIDGNFDRHDALAMLMLLREDKLRMRGTRSMQDLDNERSAGYLGNDPFFEKNYKSSKRDNY